MRLLALIVALTCLVLIGCSSQSDLVSSQSDLIAGKWRSADGKTTYEFRSDGKYEYHGPPPLAGALGPYRIDGNNLSLTVKMPTDGGQWQDETTVYEFKVTGDVLNLGGVTYNRVKE